MRGFSCSPRMRACSTMAFLCFSMMAVTDSFLMPNSLEADVPSSNAFLANSCCRRNSSLCLAREPSTVVARWPSSCSELRAAVTSRIPDPPCRIPSRTRKNASFTSSSSNRVKSSTGIFATFANVAVLPNIPVMAWVMAVDEVSVICPYLSSVAAMPISAFGATPASRFVKSTIYPSLAVEAIPSSLIAEPTFSILCSNPYSSCRSKMSTSFPISRMASSVLSPRSRPRATLIWSAARTNSKILSFPVMPSLPPIRAMSSKSFWEVRVSSFASSALSSSTSPRVRFVVFIASTSDSS